MLERQASSLSATTSSNVKCFGPTSTKNAEMRRAFTFRNPSHPAQLFRNDMRCNNKLLKASSDSNIHASAAFSSEPAVRQPRDVPQAIPGSSTSTSAKTNRLPDPLPTIDWSRYNLQLLFVDRTDTVRARVAAGLFERIAEWNGYARAIYPWACGLHAEERGHSSISKLAAIMTSAASIGLPPKQFAKSAERFDVEDLDRFDLILAVDSATRDEILSLVPESYYDYYSEKVCLLTSFSSYNPDSSVLAMGGLALLPLKLSFLLRSALDESKGVVDISSPQLCGESSTQQWMSMVQAMILADAGLFSFLVDAYPEDMPHYDPVD